MSDKVSKKGYTDMILSLGSLTVIILISWLLGGNFWIWIGVFFTLAIFSFLYKDNPFYKLAEYVTVGVSVGYSVVLVATNVFYPQVILRFIHEDTFLIQWGIHYRWDFIVPAILGTFMIFRIVPQYSWLSRYALALMIGAGAGMALPRSIQTYIIKQLYATLLPIDISWVGFFNLIIVVGVLSGLIYFFFSKEHKGIFGGVANIGIWFLMVGFGATFGYTVMARISLFIGRVIFILQDAFGMHFVK